MEISTDNGTTWNDLGIGALSPGYGSTLYNLSGNPLGGKGSDPLAEGLLRLGQLEDHPCIVRPTIRRLKFEGLSSRVRNRTVVAKLCAV